MFQSIKPSNGHDRHAIRQMYQNHAVVLQVGKHIFFAIRSPWIVVLLCISASAPITAFIAMGGLPF